jgi:hypothetical protein
MNTQTTIVGSVIGGLVGAAVGHFAGKHALTGAAVGAVVGGVFGATRPVPALPPASIQITPTPSGSLAQSMRTIDTATINAPSGTLQALSVDGQDRLAGAVTSYPVSGLAVGSHTVVVQWLDSSGVTNSANITLNVTAS